MNKRLSGRLFFEVSSFSVAALVTFLIALTFLVLVNKGCIRTNTGIKQKRVSISSPTANCGLFSNYTTGDSAEIAFLSSLSRPNQITLMGSSEFSDGNLVSYNFIPSEFGIPVVGFGHAFHQSFAMYCEMLAGNEYLPGSKVLFFISPGWFLTKGTNSAAFLEFVPPHFLEKIWMDEKVTDLDKMEIGRFLAENRNEYNAITPTMKSFIDFYSANNQADLGYKLRTVIENKNPSLKSGTKYTYQLQANLMKRTQSSFDFPTKMREAKQSFLLNCANNQIYVDSIYYNGYVPFENGKVKLSFVENIDPIEENREFKDLLLLIDLCKRRKVNCSFVIQGLNPYFYENLEAYDPFINGLVEKLETNNFPFINLFTNNKKEYEPGTLTDVMHLGELGWLKVNQFILKTYRK